MSINPGKKEIESLKEAVAYVETMEKDLREMEAAYDELVEKCDRLEHELKEAKEDELDKDEVYASLCRERRENAALHQKMEVLEKQLETVKKDRNKISSDYDDACHEIDGLRGAINKLESDITCKIPSVLLQALIDDILDSDAEWVKDDLLDFFDRMLKRMKEHELYEIDSDQDD